MACHAIYSWTFCDLVRAFLDLALAYLLLCGSTLAFFVSKFLGFLGLCLPCPCNGLFGVPNTRNCLQRLLVDNPGGKISSVHMSVKNNFPFDSILMKDQGCQLNVKLVRDKDQRDVAVELEGEEASSSISDLRRSKSLSVADALPKSDLVGFGLMNSTAVFEGKGKGILNQKPRSGLKQQRRGAAVEYGRSSSVSSCDPSCLNPCYINNSPYRIRNEIIEESSVSANAGGDDLQNEAHWGTSVGESFLLGFEVKESLEEKRVLEQALEEEHAARADLYVELEKERSAAATAANEAMAMILRLQKDKASIEMEARQYQRMIEEKSAYDAEEMNILTEILVRREREKHFLEKEVEAFRQMFFAGNEQQLEGNERDMADTGGQRPMFLLDTSDDPVLMLQGISYSISNTEMVTDLNRYSEREGVSVQTLGKELAVPDWDEDTTLMKQEFQEKGIVSMDENPSFPQVERQRLEVDGELYKSRNSEEHSLLAKTVMAPKLDKAHTETDVNLPYVGEDLKNRGKDADQGGGSDPRGSATLDAKPTFHDVHVIDYNSKMFKGESGKCSVVPRINILCDQLSVNKKTRSEPSICRSNSDMTTRLPPMGNSRGKPLLSYLRRNSISAVDNERLKIDNEVEWLRERLKKVKEGREKLSFSVKHQERETIQLQLLEDIARQIREIRHLTEPGKDVRQASLPPPSSMRQASLPPPPSKSKKGMTTLKADPATSEHVSLKKRRRRSASGEVHESN